MVCRVVYMLCVVLMNVCRFVLRYMNDRCVLQYFKNKDGPPTGVIHILEAMLVIIGPKEVRVVVAGGIVLCELM